ncbi:hypothetical protein CANCADRAFT_15064, partial [Tortispora caseinolytica NRRL Y-17796]
WQPMPIETSYDLYDDDGNLIAEATVPEESKNSKGYTRVCLAEDEAEDMTAIEEDTEFLLGNANDELERSTLEQMQMTKELLSDSEKFAYVGLCKVATDEMAADLARLIGGKKSSRYLNVAQRAHGIWSQRIINRLYHHLDISEREQKMFERLSSHGILSEDLAPSLKKSAHVENPIHKPRSATVSSQSSSIDSRATHNIHGDSLAENDSHSITDTAATFSEVKGAETIQNTKTLDIDVKWTVLCDLFLILLAESVYDARSRTLLMHVGRLLDVGPVDICKFERRVTDAMQIEEGLPEGADEHQIIEDRRKRALKRKYMYIGIATLGGGLVLGLSAGLLAPVIGTGLAAGLTTIGISGTSGFLAGAGGAAVVTTTGATIGAGIGSRGMTNRMRHVKTFEFTPLYNSNRVNLILTVSGWVIGKQDDVRLPFSTVDPLMGDLFSVLWEPEILQSMGQTINILASEILTQSIQQVLQATAFTALMTSLQWPIVLTKLGYILDNPWNVSLDRAWSAGLILADTLMQRNLGVRPVTLIGFSLGARVIYSCLIELSKKSAYGLVENVFIFGGPIVVKRDQFVMARSVVSGRFVNGYSSSDWVLGYLFRATGGGIGNVAGLAEVKDIYGVENKNCSEHVRGHMAYREAMPVLLRELGFRVMSDQFEEIEDPDPDKQRERQRELLQEYGEAREAQKNAPVKKKPSGFKSWFKRNKRNEWMEMADESYKIEDETTAAETAETVEAAANTAATGEDGLGDMFDLDAIRQEV